MSDSSRSGSSRSSSTQTRTKSSAAKASVGTGTNLVVLRGVLTRRPEFRVLASGDELLQCDVTIRPDDGPAESAPVIWADPPERAVRLDEGQEVIVVGRVRRRFFRAGGNTASRTEVCADTIAPVSASASVRAAVGAAIAALQSP